jgi:hypothetical protein
MEDRKIYEGGRCIGTLKASREGPQILNKTQLQALGIRPKEDRMAQGVTAVPTVGLHKFMTLVTEVRDGEKIAHLYNSRRHPDEPCECAEDEYEGDDVHDELRMTFKLDLIRIDDKAGLIG